MRTIKIILAIWVLAAIIAGVFGNISVAAENGLSTASFLSIGVGAKAYGMNQAFTAAADDASAVYWNPAALPTLLQSQVQFSHYSWYQDISLQNLYVAFPGQIVSFGAGVTYFDFGSFEAYDDLDGQLGQMSMHSMAALISLSVAFNEMFSLGVTGKYIEQSFDIASGKAFAGDVGVLADFGTVRAGAMVANIGSKMKYRDLEEDLPIEFRGGIALNLVRGTVFAIDARLPQNGSMTVHNGLDFALGENLSLRGGLSYDADAPQAADQIGYTMGVGLALGFGRFDYTFIPDDAVHQESIHSFSLSFGW